MTPVFKWVELYQYRWGAEAFDLFRLEESNKIQVRAKLVGAKDHCEKNKIKSEFLGL